MNRLGCRLGFVGVSVLIAAAATAVRGRLQEPVDWRRLAADRLGADYEGTQGVLLQKSRNDCGPATLAMLLQRLGIRVDYGALVRRAGLHSRGTTLVRLRDLAGSYGVSCRVRRSPSSAPTLTAPAIAHFKAGHFVLIESLRAGRLRVLDPAIGNLEFQEPSFRRHWSGALLVCTSPFLPASGASIAQPPSSPDIPGMRPYP